jgi:hypothetical protein
MEQPLIQTIELLLMDREIVRNETVTEIAFLPQTRNGHRCHRTLRGPSQGLIVIPGPNQSYYPKGSFVVRR